MTDLGRFAMAVRRIVDAALVLLVVAVLAAIAIAKLPELAGSQTLLVAGGSLEPALGVGSAVVVEPVAPGDVVVGDIVSLRVRPADTLFTHRVIRIVERDGEPWFETKGDANPTPDPSLVPPGWIVGRVATTIPMIGYLLALLSIPTGAFFILGLGATLLVLAWLLESIEWRGAADAHRASRRTGSGWPAITPTANPARRVVHTLVERGVTGVHRMVPEGGRRPGWRSAEETKPGKAV